MADVTKIKSQIIALLGIGEKAAGANVYSGNIGDGDWTSGEIDRAIEEAKMIVGEELSRAKNPKLRTAFLQTDQTITNGAPVPNHFGEISKVEIVPYSGATYNLTGKRASAQEIASYRANPNNVHSETNHNASGSIYGKTFPSDLAGKYATDEDIFTFTGFSATITYADPTSVAIASFPVSTEVPITHLAVGILGKDGTVSEKFAEHYQIGMERLGSAMREEDEQNTKD